MKYAVAIIGLAFILLVVYGCYVEEIKIYNIPVDQNSTQE